MAQRLDRRVRRHARLQHRVAGGGGERCSARVHRIGGRELERDSLKGLSKRWTRVDSVPFGKNFDIDHVLISDAGVFAVETKFTASEWSLSSPALRNAVERRALEGAQDQVPAGPSRASAGDRGAHHLGPGAPTIPTGFQVDDRVVVCRGSSAKEWRAYLEGLEPRSTRRRCPRWSTSSATTPRAPSEHRRRRRSPLDRRTSASSEAYSASKERRSGALQGDGGLRDDEVVGTGVHRDDAAHHVVVDLAHDVRVGATGPTRAPAR